MSEFFAVASIKAASPVKAAIALPGTTTFTVNGATAEVMPYEDSVNKMSATTVDAKIVKFKGITTVAQAQEAARQYFSGSGTEVVAVISTNWKTS